MGARRKENRFTTQLPATPCTSQMRAEIVRIAELEDKSVAEIQRSAYALFLARRNRKAKSIVSSMSIANNDSLK
jgi:hypothetical protein